MRRRVRVEEESEINITPLLDIVFIMLIFFFISNCIAKNFKFHLNSKLEIFFVLITEEYCMAGHNSILIPVKDIFKATI